MSASYVYFFAHLPFLHNRHYNFAFTSPIACNVARELLDVIYQLCSAQTRRRATNTLAERNGLTRHLTLKWSKYELG